MSQVTLTKAANAAARARMIEGAKRYAAADRSDPFALIRALTHIECGVATVIRNEHNREYSLDRAQTGFYNADPHTYDRDVKRLGKVPTVGYRNVVRP